MKRDRSLVLALAVLGGTVLGVRPAAADDNELGLFFGPRTYSSDSRLGYIEDAPYHPDLDNAIGFGIRYARPFFPWFIPEIEFAIAPTHTNVVGNPPVPSVDVVWLEPRVHVRFDLLHGHRFDPFILVGGAAPIVASAARKTYDSGITAEGYAGAGIRIDTKHNFAVRADARVALVAGIDHVVDPEIEVNIGIELQVGDPHLSKKTKVVALPPPDKDEDGIPDDKDQCVDRAEDADGFEDLDGCPDIDNDGDLVLDIADKCTTVPELYNGFEDDDGCPDTLPPEVDHLRGTVEGLIYAEGETVVRDSALASINDLAALMAKYPSIRVVLHGHTDDQEAKQFQTTEEGQPPADLAALSLDLSKARAQAVKEALVAAGVKPLRIDVEGHGAEEPVADNDTPRARLANRRVEVKLYVPQRRQ